MPVFNTVKRIEAGEMMLRRAIESLLNQTFRDFELIILDNISEDSTFDICQSYAQTDTRVRLIRDTMRRPPADGNAHLFNFVRGKYIMHGSDDDEWHPEHLARCIQKLEAHSDIDLVYTNFQYIDPANTILGPPVLKPDVVYPRQYSPFCSTCRYIVQRTPVPILIGIFRTEAYRSLQPFLEFDSEFAANADNLYMIRYFLRGFRSDYIDEPLFFYRSRPRHGHVSDPATSWLTFVKHQCKFRLAILNELTHPRAIKLSRPETLVLHAVLNRAFVYHSLNLLSYVLQNEIAPEDSENLTRLTRLDLLRKLILPELDSLSHALPPETYALSAAQEPAALVYYQDSIENMRKLLEIVRCADFFSTGLGTRIKQIEEEIQVAIASRIDHQLEAHGAVIPLTI